MPKPKEIWEVLEAFAKAKEWHENDDETRLEYCLQYLSYIKTDPVAFRKCLEQVWKEDECCESDNLFKNEE